MNSPALMGCGTPPAELIRSLEESLKEIREEVEQLDFSKLPYVEITNRDVSKQLASHPAVYLLIENAKYGPHVLYVGKTVNLHSRWHVPKRNLLGGEHKCLGRCIKRFEQHGVPIRLAWLQLDRQFIAATEMLLINIWNPPWNKQKA